MSVTPKQCNWRATGVFDKIVNLSCHKSDISIQFLVLQNTWDTGIVESCFMLVKNLIKYDGKYGIKLLENADEDLRKF